MDVRRSHGRFPARGGLWSGRGRRQERMCNSRHDVRRTGLGTDSGIRVNQVERGGDEEASASRMCKFQGGTTPCAWRLHQTACVGGRAPVSALSSCWRATGTNVRGKFSPSLLNAWVVGGYVVSTDGTTLQPIIRKKALCSATINTNRYDNKKRVREKMLLPL